MSELRERDPLVDELAALFDEADPVPDHVLAAALAAPEVVAAWRDLDAGLLELLLDTATEAVPVGVRGGDGPRLVTFGTAGRPDGCSVEVEVGVEPAGTLRLVGLVVPTGPNALEVRHANGVVRVPVDELGRFRAAGVPSGPLSLVIHSNGERPAATDWITV